MAKQTRLATTLTARYFPTTELTDAFYMDGRVTSKTVARSADLTNDKEDRGFFFSVFSHQTIADYDPNTLPPYEPVLRRLGTELKSGRRSLDDQIGEMVNTAVSITGRMKIQQDNNRAPFFAGVMVKDAEAFAITIGKGLAFLYRDDTLYPMTAADIRIDAINTQRQKVDNFYNFCATKTAPALCSNIAQLKLDDCIILCNREVYEALGQQELLRILYDAEDQSDAASVVITEAAAKLPGVPLQFMISFVEDITSSDRGGFFGFGRKKKKEPEPEYEEDYDVSAPIPMDSPAVQPKNAEIPKDAMLFGDEKPKKDLSATASVPVAGAVAATGVAAGAAATAAGAAATAATTAATAEGAKTAAEAASATTALEAAIKAAVPEPEVSFGDVNDLMKNDASGSAPAKTEAPKEEPKKDDTKLDFASDDGETKVVPFVSSIEKAAAELDAKIAENEAASPFVVAKPAEEAAAAAKDVTSADEPFVAVKNADNPFFKAAVQAQAKEVKAEGETSANVEEKKEDGPDDFKASFEVGGDVEEGPKDDAPLYLGDDLIVGKAPAASENKPEGEAKAEQASDSDKASDGVAETDADAPLVFEADGEVNVPMNDDQGISGGNPKEFDETPLFFGDAEASAEEKYETHEGYPSDYAEMNSAPSEALPESSDDFVIPFASTEAPNNATASSNDIPEMPIYEAPSYTPPTYPTNSDTPVGYEDTGVYARGSYEVDEDEANPAERVSPFVDASAAASPFVSEATPAFGDTSFGGMEIPTQEAPSYEAPSYETPTFVADEPAADVSGYTAFDNNEPSGDIPSYVDQGAPATQYDLNNPPPAVADLFDFDTPATSPAEQITTAAAPSPVPPYMQQGGAVRPGNIPGVSRRPASPNAQRSSRPNTQGRRRMDTIDDGFDNGEGQGTNYLPYVLAAVSVICLIIIISLLAKSCSDSKKKKAAKDTSEVNASVIDPDTSDSTPEDTSDPAATTPPADTTPDPGAVSTDPIGVFVFSDKSGCRTWWDLFNTVYGIKIESETDARVTTILTYNGLDTSYVPKAGDEIKLPPAAMLQGTGG